MPPFAGRSSGGRGKHSKGGQQSRNTRNQLPKGKRQRETRQSKHQKPNSSSSQPDTASPQSKAMTVMEPICEFFPDVPTPTRDRIARAQALHAKWKIEDLKEVVEGDALVARQRQRCKDVGVIIFGFVLQEAQVDVICTLFFEKRDLLFLARTGFGKSLIFQLIPFMLDPTGVVIILMPLKLLQAEQNAMINKYHKAKPLL